MILQTTLSLAAAAAVINFWLALRIVQMRVGDKVMHGDGGNPRLQRRMRAQANYVEYTPFLLILIAAIELTGRLAIVGALYMLARVAHAFGIDRDGPNVLRAGGFSISVLTLLGLAGVAVAIALGWF